MNDSMELTATPAMRNTRYTGRTKIISARFPLDLASKLEAMTNASALIVAATAKALAETQEPDPSQTDPAL